MDVLHQSRRGGLAPDDAGWALQRALLSHLEQVWRQPDEGIWEVRGPRQQFTYSKVMAWVAFDRAVRDAEEFGLDGPVDRWREYCATDSRTTSARRASTRSSDSLRPGLWLAPSRRQPAALADHGLPAARRPPGARHGGGDRAAPDGRRAGLPLRHAEVVPDGLPSGEGVFIACSSGWRTSTSCSAGWTEARRLFERVLALRNDVGLLAEEYDTARAPPGRQFPAGLVPPGARQHRDEPGQGFEAGRAARRAAAHAPG